ncbi:class I SAM-dependent DNA methyltransferase [Kocuria coralli]|uniref:class I SAM-dependent DNA methyltransferase n=1 Tax=Kocuria coralli TaxID=1461025 RepID=UPI0015F2D07A|nr:class I SAM-dependent methyltransferase [Kocuria coralli]
MSPEPGTPDRAGRLAPTGAPADRLTTLWEAVVAKDPQHSDRYVRRFETMREQGADLDGEARLIDAMLSRHSLVLDAGCGPGRIGGELSRRGHQVVGVDVDPVLIEAARRDHPAVTWLHGDFAHLDVLGTALRPAGSAGFDAIVCAGNVMTFLAPGTHRSVLSGFRAHLAPQGRAVVGFGTGRGYDPEQFFDDAETAGFATVQRFSTWDLRPYRRDSDFLVAILSTAGER